MGAAITPALSAVTASGEGGAYDASVIDDV